MTFKICGIFENTAFTIRDAWGVMLVRHDYLNIFTSHFYNLGNSLKKSYLSFKWCKEIGKNWSFSMFLCLSKFAGSSKNWLILCGTHGVLLVRHRYLNTYTSGFHKLGISFKRRY